MLVVLAGSLTAGHAQAQKKPREAPIFVELNKRARPTVNIPSLAPLVEQAGPACLVVYSIGRRNRPGPLPKGHPSPGAGPRGATGQGAGFIIHPSGYALTNFHVIERAKKIQVTVGTGLLVLDAEVIGTDKRADVALIKLKGSRRDWPVIPLGDSDELKVGDFLVAIGNPFGLDQTVSMGILSAKSRRDIAPSSRQGLFDFLQTDASINPGNSGGPLLNLHGEAVGMNTAVNAAAQGIGFAIPVNMIKAMLDDLRREGRVVRSWIGVGIQPLNGALAKKLGLAQPYGAVVRQVVDKGPADQAGMKPGDVLTHFGSHKILRANELPLLAAAAGVGETVEIRVWRDGKTKRLQLKLAEHPGNAKKRSEKSASASSASQAPRAKQGQTQSESPKVSQEAKSSAKAKKKLGLMIVNLEDADRSRLSLEPEVTGTRVLRVVAGSAAEESGLVVDDIIIRAEGEKIESAQGFAALSKKAASGEVLRLLVLRQGATHFVALVKP